MNSTKEQKDNKRGKRRGRKLQRQKGPCLNSSAPWVRCAWQLSISVRNPLWRRVMPGLVPSPGDNGHIILYFSYISMGSHIRQAGAQQELLHHQLTVGLRLNTSLSVPSEQISQLGRSFSLIPVQPLLPVTDTGKGSGESGQHQDGKNTLKMYTTTSSGGLECLKCLVALN